MTHEFDADGVANRLVDKAVNWSVTGSESARYSLLGELQGLCSSSRQDFYDVARALNGQYSVDLKRDAGGTIKEIDFNMPDGKRLAAPGCAKPNEFDAKSEEETVHDLAVRWHSGSESARESLFKEVCRLSPQQLSAVAKGLKSDYGAEIERNGNDQIIGINMGFQDGSSLYIPANVCDRTRESTQAKKR